MKKKPLDKLEGINANDFHFIVTSVVFVTKKHPVILNLDNAMVPYSDSVSVSAEIFNNILRFSERGFTIYHPIFGKKILSIAEIVVFHSNTRWYPGTSIHSQHEFFSSL